MKIALVNFSRGGLCGGSRKYLRHVVPILRADPRVDELSIFLPPKFEFPECGPCLTWPEGSSFSSISFIKRKLVGLNPDVVFVPNFWCLGTRGVPVVVMMRNMELADMPFARNSSFDLFLNFLRQTVARRDCRKATRVIGVSNFVSQFLETRWKIPAAKIDRVYHGISPVDATSRFSRPATLTEADSRPFVFTAGCIRPYRGLEDVLLAVADPRLKRHGLRLVIAGAVEPGSDFYRRELDQLVEKYNLQKDVVFAGSLNESEMNWCYHHCRLFVMTSRVEACPNIALEAMSHGCRIVSTQNPPMPEFFRDSSVYYNAGQAEELALRMNETLAEADALRFVKTNRARKIASEFSWKRTADETLLSLERAISQTRRQ